MVLNHQRICMKRIVVGIILAFSAVVPLMAAGTDYGTSIANQATLSYQVGGNNQTDITSNTDTFVVDRKVDVLVATTDTTNVIVTPGDNVSSDTKPLTFTVKNETNGNQDFILGVANLANGVNTLDAGETDNIDFATDLKICTDATCSGGDISGQNISFTEDETKTYYVFADIPVGTADASWASIALTATAVNDGSTTAMTQDSGADDPAAVQIVFADDAGTTDSQYDGKHSSFSAYEVQSATLAVTKGSCVIWDPVNTTTNPKRIPLGMVRYTIEVKNTGSADATTVSLSDALNTNLTYGQSSAAGAPTAVHEVRDAACDCASPAGGVIAGDTVSESGGTVTVNYNTVGKTGTTGANSATKCAYFDVTIN